MAAHRLVQERLQTKTIACIVETYKINLQLIMGTKLIQLDDGTLVEVQVPDDQAEQISGGFAERVDATFDKVKPLLIKACKPIAETWKELNQDVNIEQAEVEIGLGFEGEGNLYITRSVMSANLKVKLTLKPQK